MFGMHSKRAEPRPKPRLFIFTKHTKEGRAVSKASQSTGSVDRTASSLTVILLRENLFAQRWDVIELSKDVIYIYLANDGDIPEFIHKVSKGHACSWRDL